MSYDDFYDDDYEDDIIDFDVYFAEDERAYQAMLDAEMDALDALDPTLNKRAWRQKLVLGKTGNQYYVSGHRMTPVTGKRTKVERIYDRRNPRKPKQRNRDRRREREQFREMLLAS